MILISVPEAAHLFLDDAQNRGESALDRRADGHSNTELPIQNYAKRIADANHDSGWKAEAVWVSSKTAWAVSV